MPFSMNCLPLLLISNITIIPAIVKEMSQREDF